MKFAVFALLVSSASAQTCNAAGTADESLCVTGDFVKCQTTWDDAGAAIANTDANAVCVIAGDCTVASATAGVWTGCLSDLTDAQGATDAVVAAKAAADTAAAAVLTAWNDSDGASFAGLIVAGLATACTADTDCTADALMPNCATYSYVDSVSPAAAPAPAGYVNPTACVADADCTDPAKTEVGTTLTTLTRTTTCVADAAAGDGTTDDATGDAASTACADDGTCATEGETCVGWAWASEDTEVDGYELLDDAARKVQADLTACMTADACTATEDLVLTGNTFAMACFAMKNVVAASAAALALASAM